MRPPIYVYFHEGNSYHDSCLLQKLTGHPISKGTRPDIIHNRLTHHGQIPREVATWDHAPCRVCNRHIRSDHPPDDYVKDSPDTFQCNLCRQGHIPDIYQHDRWHKGLPYLAWPGR